MWRNYPILKKKKKSNFFFKKKGKFQEKISV